MNTKATYALLATFNKHLISSTVQNWTDVCMNYMATVSYTNVISQGQTSNGFFRLRFSHR